MVSQSPTLCWKRMLRSRHVTTCPAYDRPVVAGATSEAIGLTSVAQRSTTCIGTKTQHGTHQQVQGPTACCHQHPERSCQRIILGLGQMGVADSECGAEAQHHHQDQGNQHRCLRTQVSSGQVAPIWVTVVAAHCGLGMQFAQGSAAPHSLSRAPRSLPVLQVLQLTVTLTSVAALFSVYSMAPSLALSGMMMPSARAHMSTACTSSGHRLSAVRVCLPAAESRCALDVPAAQHRELVQHQAI